MEKPLIVYSNVPASKEWPTNFKLLFQALCMYHKSSSNNKLVHHSKHLKELLMSYIYIRMYVQCFEGYTITCSQIIALK